MENNSINNHIHNNTCRDMERNMQGRMNNERDMTERLLRREENGYSCQGNEIHHTDRVNCRSMENHYPSYHPNHEMNYCHTCKHGCENEHGGEVYVLNVERMANKNEYFRESVWTGEYLQMTLMSIPRGCDIGVEIHEDTDQYIRVEHGNALAITGHSEHCLHKKNKLCAGDAIFIPAGTWHNIVNTGRCDLKLSSVYAPPHHSRCTVEPYKK